MRTTKLVEQLNAEVERLRAQLETAEAEAMQLRADRNRLQLERDELQAEVDRAAATRFAVLLDDDEVVRDGLSESDAIHLARSLFWETEGHPHTRVVGDERDETWSTRTRGYIRSPEGVYWPPVPV